MKRQYTTTRNYREKGGGHNNKSDKQRWQGRGRPPRKLNMRGHQASQNIQERERWSLDHRGSIRRAERLFRCCSTKRARRGLINNTHDSKKCCSNNSPGLPGKAAQLVGDHFARARLGLLRSQLLAKSRSTCRIAESTDIGRASNRTSSLLTLSVRFGYETYAAVKNWVK